MTTSGRPLPRWIAWPLRVYAAYLLLCLLVLLPALNILAPKAVREQLNRELRSELILFNPFSLALEVRGAKLVENDGHQPLGFSRLQANLSLASLWEPGLVLDSFLVDQLDVHVLRHSNGEFHFADLLGVDSEDDAGDDPASGELPGITILDVAINAHTLRFSDQTKPGNYSTVQKDFDLRTQNLTTVPGRRGDGRLELVSDGGGRVRWDGELKIAEGHSQGTLVLQNIDLTPVWRYEAQRLPFVAHSARFDATLNYTADWSRDFQLLLDESRLRLYRIDLEPADSDALPDTALRLEDLQVNDITFDLAAQRIGIGTTAVAGLALNGFDENGEPSLLKMFEFPADEATATAEDSAVRAEDEGSTQAWALSLGGFTLKDSEINWKTDYLSPESMHVAPIAVSAGALQWPAGLPTPFELTLAINGESDLRVGGQLNIASGDGDVTVALAGWQIPWLNPVINAQVRSDISRGTFGLESEIALVAFSPDSVAASLNVRDLATVLQATREEAFTLEALSIDGILVDTGAQSVRVDELMLQRPTGSLHILEDGTINVNGIVRERTEGTADTPALDDREQGQEWSVYLKHLGLRNGRLDFADASLPLPFKTLIDGIEADVRDIDTASGNPLTIELKGAVDGYAPVLIQGGGSPLAENRNGELRFNFRGVDIATMSPYSGTYAGYTIDSGTLSLDLRYALDGQKLNGDNRIVISQMQLGEPIESELAIDVPLKLGLALLTDSRGVIDLSVPISGDVDSPDFSLGPIIGKAIKNIIVKAVTAPFSLLAGLVGSEDDLENIAFAPGSSELSTESREALGALAEALAQRPQLSLRVAGGSDPKADSLSLKERVLEESLIADGLAPEALQTRGDEFLAVLQKRYATLNLDNQGVTENEPVSTEALWAALLDHTALAPDALQQLATARAAAAKRELVSAGAVDAARIAIAYDQDLNSSGVKMNVGS